MLGTSSGGSHTWWAGRPLPFIRATAMSNTARVSSGSLTATGDSSTRCTADTALVEVNGSTCIEVPPVPAVDRRRRPFGGPET